MKVSIIAAVGLRGQLAKDGVIPWNCLQDRIDFVDATRNGIMIAGMRTYNQMSAAISKESLDATGRQLLGWTPAVPTEHIMALAQQDIRRRPIWIVGGAFTYAAFHKYVNGDIIVNVVEYDNPPTEDDRHVFFPVELYGLCKHLPAACVPVKPKASKIQV